MKATDRKKAPQVKRIETISIQRADRKKLDNGIPVYSINAGEQDLVRIDMIFNAGQWYQQSPLVASATNSLMPEGTKNYLSSQLAEKIDYYGAVLNQGVDKDFATFSMLTLNKYIDKTLPLLEEVIKYPLFPENELSVFLKNTKQQLMVEMEKVKTLALRQYWRSLFGDEHPYGRQTSAEDFDFVKRKQLSAFHQRHYNAGNCRIVVSGNVTGHVSAELNRFFGGKDWQGKPADEGKDLHPVIKPAEKLHVVDKENAVQSAIRMGNVTINKLHADYPGLQILNTIFGGYFGSRLMANIREDKGFTYGIGSAVVSLKHAGYFVIVSEVGANVARDAVKEIYYEIDRLKSEPVPEEELETVKSYIMGEMLKSFDGPFALADSVRSIIDYGLDYDYFDRYIETIRDMDSKTLLKLASRYLVKEKITGVIAGKY